ncbi:maleylpyruvate isomerase family mycothiol-dependent enzyme [Streptomyces sp. NPDC006733]|uniref:maleylpyruvate isomerase family mycothiol-dependent enzyme n=1 Tax=Streptomyces sp. NPDC006733 TaxID=3155460 RepID=UPI0033EF952E
MDYVPHFQREIEAFEAAIRRAAGAGDALPVPSCPDWTVSDLVLHLGGVHRFVAAIVENGLMAPPDVTDVTLFALPDDRTGWPTPESAPSRGPVPPGLVDWFADGARALAALFGSVAGDRTVWTWSQERTVAFWVRMQTIEAALHRWDAEGVTGAAQPVAAELARDAVSQTFEVMAPARRAWKQAPPGAGERFGFRATDVEGAWTVSVTGDDVRLTAEAGPCDVELAGTASDLMLYLWNRIPADHLEAKGDQAVLDRYFTLVPPV